MTIKYKAGDEVTFKLDQTSATCMNTGEPPLMRNIISHTPKRDLLDEACDILPKDIMCDLEYIADARQLGQVKKAVELILSHLREREEERG